MHGRRPPLLRRRRLLSQPAVPALWRLLWLVLWRLLWPSLWRLLWRPLCLPLRWPFLRLLWRLLWRLLRCGGRYGMQRVASSSPLPPSVGAADPQPHFIPRGLPPLCADQGSGKYRQGGERRRVFSFPPFAFLPMRLTSSQSCYQTYGRAHYAPYTLLHQAAPR